MLKSVTYVLSGPGYSGRRPVGVNLREEVENYIKTIQQDTIIILDMQNVKYMDCSVADEVIYNIALRSANRVYGEKYFIIKSANEYAREEIIAALRLRKYACIHIDTSGKYEILGGLSPELKDTYLFALERETVTARDLMNNFKELRNVSAASNRLSRLRAMGLLCMAKGEIIEGGGRQYVYEAVK